MKTPKTSEETNAQSQTGKHSFHFFQKKKVSIMSGTLIHVFPSSTQCSKCKCMTAVGERGQPADSAYFGYVLAHFPRSTFMK